MFRLSSPGARVDPQGPEEDPARPVVQMLPSSIGCRLRDSRQDCRGREDQHERACGPCHCSSVATRHFSECLFTGYIEPQWCFRDAHHTAITAAGGSTSIARGSTGSIETAPILPTLTSATERTARTSIHDPRPRRNTATTVHIQVTDSNNTRDSRHLPMKRIPPAHS